MTASLLLDNLLAWSAQVCILAAAGALAALTLRHPRARLIFWQGLLAIALLLPAVEPWTQPAPEAAGEVSIVTGPATITGDAPSSRGIPRKREYLLFVIALGAMLRTLWIATGLMRLRRIRLEARPLTESVIPFAPFSTRPVRWYASQTIPGPVTFGWLRPAIVLPVHVLDFPDDLRKAIGCHELEHVRRRDWLFVLAEELIRSALWFHPAVWFVLSRIQLAREQAVDLEVVRLTQDRGRYLDALLAVAAHKVGGRSLRPAYAGSDVAPAPLFLKKRQLAVRVAAVLKETSMSKSRLIASSATIFSAALVAARLAVFLFPLQSQAQTLPDSPGVTVEAGAALLHRAPVVYSPETRSMGAVVIDASVNSRGEVTDARVLSGPDELRREALASVLQWHYSTETGLPPAVRVAIRKFGPVAADPPPAPLAGPQLPNSFVKGIQFAGLPPELEQKLRDALPVREGDAFSPDMLARVRAAAKGVDEHMLSAMSVISTADGRKEVTLRFSLSGTASGAVPQPGVVPLTAPSGPPVTPGTPNTSSAAATPSRIRVGGNLQANNLITKVTPVYPPEAKAERIQGTVRFTATIGKDGAIQNLELVSGHPMLVPSATEAVKQWVYRPTLLNGEPVEVITLIDINYTLRDPQ